MKEHFVLNDPVVVCVFFLSLSLSLFKPSAIIPSAFLKLRFLSLLARIVQEDDYVRDDVCISVFSSGVEGFHCCGFILN